MARKSVPKASAAAAIKGGKGKAKKKEEDHPLPTPVVDEEGTDASDEEDEDDLPSVDGDSSSSDSDDSNDSLLDSGDQDEDEEDFEDQGSSSDESDVLEAQQANEEDDDEDDDGIEYLGSSDEEEDGENDMAAQAPFKVDDSKPRAWRRPPSKTPQKELLRKGVPTSKEETTMGRKRDAVIESERASGRLAVAAAMHADDLSSDDEDGGGGRGGEGKNAIGRVPLHWYDDYEHLGYDVHGQKVMKSKKADGLDAALASRDDPNYARTVYDAVHDKHIILSDRDLEIIRRLQKGAFAHPEHEAYPPQVDVYCDELNIFGPSIAEPKRRFVPSKWELMKVTRMVKAIKEGRMVVGKGGEAAAAREKREEKQRQVYLLWKEEEGEDEEERRRKGPRHIPAPKLPLPGHAESYNPPEEYLFSKEEEEEWRAMDPEDRPLPFLPKKFSSLRAVGAYSGFIKERFERCLDLYLCPRSLKKQGVTDASVLLPSLPNPRDLRPFPTSKAIEYVHALDGGRVRAVALSLDGQYLASGGEDGRVCLWEVESGYCLKTWRLKREGGGEGGGEDGVKVLALAWNPNPAHHVLAVAGGRGGAFLLRTRTGGKEDEEVTEALLTSGLEGSRSSSTTSAGKSIGVKWQAYKSAEGGEEGGDDLVLRMEGGGECTSVRWHSKGDYLASVSPTGGSQSVMIHQVSKGKTQCPFRKTHGAVQALAFHPNKPFFFVATQTHIRVYHLLKQVLVKKLLTGCKWISSLDVHPSGDHVIISSYDRRVVWFDLDLSSLPFKTLKYHTKAVRAVAFHRTYPLMASAADDGTVHVFHATVYDDLMQNPLIVPVKILRGHEVVKEVGVMAIAFHPSQPWVVSGGADGKVILYQDAY